jgi:hypothetical protein
MAAIRHSRMLGRSITIEELSPLYSACQEARDNVGMVEDECETMELQLDQLEFELSRKGKRICEIYEQLDYDVLSEAPESDSESSQVSYETESSVDQSEQDQGHPSSKDIQVVRKTPYQNSNPMQSMHDKTNGFGSRPPIQFLSSRKSGTQSHIRLEDLNPLLDDSAPDLIAQPWASSLGSNLDEEFGAQSKEVQDTLSEGQIESVSKVLLLEGDGESAEILSGYLNHFESKHSRINRWLLHKLRISPAEIIRLHRAITEQSSAIEDWETRSLDAWEDDYPVYFSASPSTRTNSIHSTANAHQPRLIQPLALPPVTLQQEQRGLLQIDNDRRISVTSSAPAAIHENWCESYTGDRTYGCRPDCIPYSSITH